MSLQRVILYVDASDDGLTRFTEIADILDNLGHRYEARGEADLAGFCFTRAHQAREIDAVYERRATPWEDEP